MKKSVFSATALASIILFSSCADTGEYLTTNIGQEAVLPYCEDFEGDSVGNVEVLYSAMRWQVVTEDSNRLLCCTDIDENKGIAGKAVYYLAFGNETWESYSLSFDFRLSEGSSVSFAPYIETNSDTSEASKQFESTNPWVLQITSSGELYYETMFDRGQHYIVQAPAVTEGFVKDGWNHVELTPNGTELMMKLNGSDIGKVADLSAGQRGWIGLGGLVGCMIDNIRADRSV